MLGLLCMEEQVLVVELSKGTFAAAVPEMGTEWSACASLAASQGTPCL